MKGLLILLLTLVSLSCGAKGFPSDELCEAVAVAKEASSESLQGALAVLTVIRNRQVIDGMTACGVVTAPGQFSWYRASHDKPYKWKLSRKDLTRYHKLCTMSANLPSDTYFFRSSGKRGQKWLGKYYTTIGHHKFYRLT